MIALNEVRDGEFEETKLFKASALAKRLSVSERQLWRMSKAGSIPRPLQIGGCTRWRADEIARWLQCGAPARAEWEKQRATQTVCDENA